jgi:hypothetical protein
MEGVPPWKHTQVALLEEGDDGALDSLLLRATRLKAVPAGFEASLEYEHGVV